MQANPRPRPPAAFARQYRKKLKFGKDGSKPGEFYLVTERCAPSTRCSARMSVMTPLQACPLGEQPYSFIKTMMCLLCRARLESGAVCEEYARAPLEGTKPPPQLPPCAHSSPIYHLLPISDFMAWRPRAAGTSGWRPTSLA